MHSDLIEGAPGTVSQVRASAQELVRFAKEHGTAVVLVGHVTKDGTIAGPRVLEHMVDTVLSFEGERSHQYQILRAMKNRFGGTDEIGVFAMEGQGLTEVPNPCSDVDRNDKSRVCKPGTVKVIGAPADRILRRRFPHGGSRGGYLKEGFDSLDAFLSHMWAVTVIGAPKKAAAQTIEELEKNARGWYGGAVGMISLNGDINTGILIRTTYLRDGMASYPVGATLLYDSVPAMEERETRLKATGFFRAFWTPAKRDRPRDAPRARASGSKLLLVDNDDCFIHTLANYARQTGAEVVTYRAGFPPEMIDEGRAETDPDLARTGPA